MRVRDKQRPLKTSGADVWSSGKNLTKAWEGSGIHPHFYIPGLRVKKLLLSNIELDMKRVAQPA